jgi:hypothetical protein
MYEDCGYDDCGPRVEASGPSVKRLACCESSVVSKGCTGAGSDRSTRSSMLRLRTLRAARALLRRHKRKPASKPRRISPPTAPPTTAYVSPKQRLRIEPHWAQSRCHLPQQGPLRLLAASLAKIDWQRPTPRKAAHPRTTRRRRHPSAGFLPSRRRWCRQWPRCLVAAAELSLHSRAMNRRTPRFTYCRKWEPKGSFGEA